MRKADVVMKTAHFPVTSSSAPIAESLQIITLPSESVTNSEESEACATVSIIFFIYCHKPSESASKLSPDFSANNSTL